jgi:stress response protein SCP2
MTADRCPCPFGGVHCAASRVSKELAFGLHWAPPGEDGLAAAAPDLDAVCMLFDAQGRVLEAVHPDCPRSADGSVVHTGDSRDGASRWDDERIIVFLDALRRDASRLGFLVVSASGHALHEVRGATCHLSDHACDREWLRLDLTALEGRRWHAAAALQRGSAGWTIAAAR